MMEVPLFERFLERAGLPADSGLHDVVAAVQAIPYGRPRDRTVAGVLIDWIGTCSTKHALLSELISERWPDLTPRLVHRVYRAERTMVRHRFGEIPAAAVQDGGLIDVHRYLIIALGGRDVVIDVTFPSDAPWDGRSDMPLACGPGRDYLVGVDPAKEKAALEAANCDPRIREPFITALSQAH
ncbi:hypothetical protein [Actinomadura monticuli]|uniref:DUF5753 domain-containing protein n=1 Tax=Actinomadura monticuli TaxID=3097367 RepID=A0ABV4QMR3_9ACTN